MFNSISMLLIWIATSVKTQFVSGPTQDLAQLLNSTNSFNIMLNAFDFVGLDLTEAQDITLFAFTDTAFGETFPENCQITDRLMIQNILLYHILPFPALAKDFPERAESLMANDETAVVTSTGTEGNAVAKINDAEIIMFNEQATNGNIVHGIDRVLIPPSMTLPDECTFPNIIELAISAPDESLSVFLEILASAGLTEVLEGDGPFTVFMPTNSAFLALPEGSLVCLTRPGNEDALNSLLLYHVHRGTAVMSTHLSNEATLVMMNGASATLIIENDTAYFNDAKILVADVEASNGIINAIDQVLIPPDNACFQESGLHTTEATDAQVETAPASPVPVLFPVTVTPTPVTTDPVTPAPATPAPVTPAPITTDPVTTGPVTPAPATLVPVTTDPITPGPVTPAPATPVPVTTDPVTPGPVTPTPITTTTLNPIVAPVNVLEAPFGLMVEVVSVPSQSQSISPHPSFRPSDQISEGSSFQPSTSSRTSPRPSQSTDSTFPQFMLDNNTLLIILVGIVIVLAICLNVGASCNKPVTNNNTR